MKKLSAKRGFTLIEMLVVIAIIAVLVAVVIPTVQSSTLKAKAAADASNLRAMLGKANVELYKSVVEDSLSNLSDDIIVSKYDPDAVMMLRFSIPAFVDVYFVNDKEKKYYSLEYLSEIAEKGETEIGTEAPPEDSASSYYWIVVGEDAS